MTVLHHAVLYCYSLLRGNSLTNLAELLQHQLDISKADCYGNTALHLAALENRVECAKFLLERGASPLVKNVDKLTPIDCAFSARSQELVRHFRGLGI
jgi:ankyrin repeat protein